MQTLAVGTYRANSGHHAKWVGCTVTEAIQ